MLNFGAAGCAEVVTGHFYRHQQLQNWCIFADLDAGERKYQLNPIEDDYGWRLTNTLLETNMSPKVVGKINMFFPKMGYVSSQEC